MKRLLLLPTLLATILPLSAEEAAPSPRDAMRETLPAYSADEHARAVAEAEARTAAEEAAKAAAAADPDLVILPDMTVIEKAMQRMDEDSLYRKGAFDKELIKRELSEFDRSFLNRVTVPLLGVSNAARAREAYLARRNADLQDRLSRLNRMVALVDEREAGEFRDVLRDASLDNSNTAKETARSRSARGGAGGRQSQ